jgi:EAL domain-containing protein (putative c-di-GMP-specific phosphodiesterase class I)
MAIDLVDVNRALENGEFLPYFQPSGSASQRKAYGL